MDGESFPTREQSECVTERRTLIFDRFAQSMSHERNTEIGMRPIFKSKDQLNDVY